LKRDAVTAFIRNGFRLPVGRLQAVTIRRALEKRPPLARRCPAMPLGSTRRQWPRAVDAQRENLQK